MDAFFHTLLLIFRKERGQINSFCSPAILWTPLDRWTLTMLFAKLLATTLWAWRMLSLHMMLPVSGLSTLRRGSSKAHICTYPKAFATFLQLESSILVLTVKLVLRNSPWTLWKEQDSKMGKFLRPCGHPWTRQLGAPGLWPHHIGKKWLMPTCLILIGRKLWKCVSDVLSLGVPDCW